jgi:AcrR family transcriptional regulator
MKASQGAPKSAPPPGLRERKKQQTRLAISQVATRLFIERGFDHVTVAEVAAAAEVSVNTIFNYFATKEELFFDRAEEVEDAPCRIVRERRPGESALAALRRSFHEMLKGRPGEKLAARLRPFLQTIEASPALKARERLLLERSEQRLVKTLLTEAGGRPDEPMARAVAALIIALEWLLIKESRRRILRGESDARLRAALRRLGERAFALLQDGITDYCTRPS